MKNSRERKDGKDERKKSIANHVSGLYGSRKPTRRLLGGVLKAQAASIGKNLEGTDGTVSGNDALTLAEGQTPGGTEEEKLTVPQNLRVEGDFIVWDEVKNAKGYRLKTTINGETLLKNCDVNGDGNKVAINRFFYEKQFDHGFVYSDRIIDFGSYNFVVCAFDDIGTNTDYSKPCTVKYEEAFTSPENVIYNESDRVVEWDAVKDARGYNIHYFKDGDKGKLYRGNGVFDSGIVLKYLLDSGDEGGDYWISVQAIAEDYCVSQWTTPIKVSFAEKIKLEAPEYFHLDESTGNLLWNKVEGADEYVIEWRFSDGTGGAHTVKETHWDSWKTQMKPFYKGDIRMSVEACSYNNNNGYSVSPASNEIVLSFQPQYVESIPVPEKLWFEDGWFRWEAVECANYCLRIWANDTLVENSDSRSSYIGSNSMPAGNYEVELFIVDENGNYNSEKYSFTLETVPDENVWIPLIYCNWLGTLEWDYDHFKHDKTQKFWIRLRKGDAVVRLEESTRNYFFGLRDLSDGEYTVDVCVYESGDKIGNWSAPLHISKHGNSLFDKENERTTEVKFPPEAVGVPTKDRITSITINPAFNMKNKTDQNVELDLDEIEVQAKAIYDEGLKRVSKALGKPISENKEYYLLDLTLLYDGKDFSNGYEGLVQVKIPIPPGHRDKTFSCYRLTETDGKMTKELIPGEQTEEFYIIYLEHFSLYLLTDDNGEGDEESHTHAYGESWEFDENSHWKECDCKATSEEAAHVFGDWNITKEATENADGMKERSCQVCGFKQTAAIPGLSHIHIYGESWKSDGDSHWKECDCKATSEVAPHDFGDWNITKEATEDAEGMKERSCSVCGFKQTEKMPKLSIQNDEEEDDAEDDTKDDTEPAGTKAEQLGARSPKTDGDTLFERCMALAMIIGFACLSLYFMLNVKWAKEP